jgi:hypothetical protein
VVDGRRQTLQGFGMRVFQTSIEIAAQPARIWALLTDAEGYPQWNSTIHIVDGSIGPGTMLAIYTKSTPGRGFPLKVVEFEPERRMVWEGVLPMRMFKGVRTLTLTPAGGAVRFDMREEFRGPLMPLIVRMIPDQQPHFDAFARDLKAAAEAG